jgi:DNA-binding response OmpR family regulator
MTVIRVLIVDDHPIFRDGLRAALSADDIEVVGEATTASEAEAASDQLHPDVVLMDLQLPGTGLEATRQIIAADPDVKVLVLTMSEDQRTVSAAVQAGAMGYLVKGVDRSKLLAAVRAVAAGEAVFGWCRVDDDRRAGGSGVPAADRAGTRGSRLGRRRSHQRGDQPSALSEPEDGAKPRVEHLDQAGCR